MFNEIGSINEPFMSRTLFVFLMHILLRKIVVPNSFSYEYIRCSSGLILRVLVSLMFIHFVVYD